jgi:hypothetical protein
LDIARKGAKTPRESMEKHDFAAPNIDVLSTPCPCALDSAIPLRLGANPLGESVRAKLGRVYDAAKLDQFPRKSRDSKPDAMSFILAISAPMCV